MRADTQEWVRCAEEDYSAASALMVSRRKHLAAAICFHVQQCVEKYLKARLAEGGLPVPQVHSLLVLLNQVLPLEPLWSAFHSSLDQLHHYAVHVRYPGHQATRGQARVAMRICRSLRKEVRLALGLPAK